MVTRAAVRWRCHGVAALAFSGGSPVRALVGLPAAVLVASVPRCRWWLVCVTYLQHHSHDTMVYDDSKWSYVLAAFETVDRKFGSVY